MLAPKCKKINKLGWHKCEAALYQILCWGGGAKWTRLEGPKKKSLSLDSAILFKHKEREFWSLLLFQESVYIPPLNIYWSIFTVQIFQLQLQSISVCKHVIPGVSETDSAVCYHKTSWPSNMHILTSVNLNMKTHTGITRPDLWLQFDYQIKGILSPDGIFHSIDRSRTYYLPLESCVFTSSFKLSWVCFV